MTSSSTLGPAASPAASARPAKTRRVVDAPTRAFHALFALSFLGAYLTADGEHWRALHVTLGYTMVGLLAFRALYGWLGPRQAGLGLLWRKLGGLPAWLRSLATGLRQASLSGIPWRQGQNLLMALAIFTLLATVVPLTLSGYGTYNDWVAGDWLEELHEFFGNAMLMVVLGHLALIVGLSLLRRRNQALPMLTGRIEGAGPDLVHNNRGWLAGLIVLGVLAFGAWQWQQYPNGLLPGQADAAGRAHKGDKAERASSLGSKAHTTTTDVGRTRAPGDCAASERSANVATVQVTACAADLWARGTPQVHSVTAAYVRGAPLNE
ncbi:MAG: cytochrome b/b6 domain-containing protein [Rubrivivax sp.]|nr:cytochrome b/b6 domain-containing protein [Rubrivivax sp.]